MHRGAAEADRDGAQHRPRRHRRAEQNGIPLSSSIGGPVPRRHRGASATFPDTTAGDASRWGVGPLRTEMLDDLPEAERQRHRANAWRAVGPSSSRQVIQPRNPGIGERRAVALKIRREAEARGEVRLSAPAAAITAWRSGMGCQIHDGAAAEAPDQVVGQRADAQVTALAHQGGRAGTTSAKGPRPEPGPETVEPHRREESASDRGEIVLSRPAADAEHAEAPAGVSQAGGDQVSGQEIGSGSGQSGPNRWRSGSSAGGSRAGRQADGAEVGLPAGRRPQTRDRSLLARCNARAPGCRWRKGQNQRGAAAHGRVSGIPARHMSFRDRQFRLTSRPGMQPRPGGRWHRRRQPRRGAMVETRMAVSPASPGRRDQAACVADHDRSRSRRSQAIGRARRRLTQRRRRGGQWRRRPRSGRYLGGDGEPLDLSRASARAKRAVGQASKIPGARCRVPTSTAAAGPVMGQILPRRIGGHLAQVNQSGAGFRAAGNPGPSTWLPPPRKPRGACRPRRRRDRQGCPRPPGGLRE